MKGIFDESKIEENSKLRSKNIELRSRCEKMRIESSRLRGRRRSVAYSWKGQMNTSRLKG